MTETTWLSFRIPYPTSDAGKADWNSRYSLNAYYAGKHWRERRDDARYWHLMVQSYLPKLDLSKGPLFGDSCVDIEILYNDQLDQDNHGCITKMIVDTLKGRLIKDDTRRYVGRISQDWHNEDCIAVTLRRREDNDKS